jgi:beta-glucosidase
LGIPELWTADGPHGVRSEVLWDEWDQAGWTNDSIIAYPALTALAATWNRNMSSIYGKSLGEEARYRKRMLFWDLGSIFTELRSMAVTSSIWERIRF